MSVQVNLDTAAHVMGRRTNRDIIGGDVYTHRQALLIDIGEVLLCLSGIFMSHIQTDVIQSVYLHFLIYGTCYDITWGQRQSLVVLLHKLFAIWQFQDTAIATHSLCDEVGWMSLFWVMEYCWVELYKLHVGHCSFGAINHRNAIASSDDRV